MLEETKKLIERQVKDGFYFDLIDYKSICQPVYLWTNENVRGYQNLFEGKKNVLSVLSSGDQIFNMLLKGVIKIDTFDNNGLTEYFTLGLKKAMILKYSYEEFLIKTKKMCSSHDNPAMSLDELSVFVKELLPYMEESNIPLKKDQLSMLKRWMLKREKKLFLTKYLWQMVL